MELQIRQSTIDEGKNVNVFLKLFLFLVCSHYASNKVFVGSSNSELSGTDNPAVYRRVSIQKKKSQNIANEFLAWLRWKNWCIDKAECDKVQWKQTNKRINHDNTWSMWLTHPLKRRKHRICVERWGDRNLPHINRVFYIVFHRFRFDWRSFNYVTLLHPLLLQRFNGTRLEN